MDLRAYRRQRKLSQDQFARLLGIHRVTLSQYERGVACPKLKALEVFRERLGLALDIPHDLQVRPKDLNRHFPNAYPGPPVPPRSPAWQRLKGTYPDILKKLGPVPDELVAWLRADSVLECLAWFLLYLFGATLCFESPVRKGYPGPPLCNDDERCLGLSPIPCLVLVGGPCSFILWPQVTIRPAWRTCRADALILARYQNRRLWVDFEVDGAGHREEGDETREQSLGLTVIRATSSEVLGLQLGQWLQNELLARFHSDLDKSADSM